MYHHARRDFVMLVRWLPRQEVDQIPPYAHSMVGVGGMVIAEDREEVLVVREKYYKQPHWKLPGGFVEPGEATPKTNTSSDVMIRYLKHHFAIKLKREIWLLHIEAFISFWGSMCLSRSSKRNSYDVILFV